MSQQFLYEQLDGAKNIGMKWPKISDFVVENLNPIFELRDYQKEAFGRFFHCYHGEFENKEYPLHFLSNMATGSGKTLIMAGLILYLYKQGYRNFLFFVNSNNIIEKTKENFLNELSSKYLFNKKIIFENHGVKINKVDNFDGINNEDINICFTTIQKMHSDLYIEKENSLTFEDFKEKKIVLLSDEAHHGQVKTKQKSLDRIFEKPNWENTVEKIFKQNSANLLLEFTATMDFMNKDIADKYRNKIIYKYSLREFRNDGFSKDVELFHTDTDRKDRIIQALVLSQYRQDVAAKHKIFLKPVILFKAQKTIAQSEDNKKLFHKVIDGLSPSDIEKIRERSNIEVLQKAFKFFKENKISDSMLVEKLKNNFSENKTLSVNEEREKEKYQILLNTLEDKNNQIRAIFAVQKLNEGWDVLNLFDIVRLYETRDGKANKPGKTTISEAQLIGRGARYFPFVINSDDDRYKRKFDKALDNELRILEELHYHSHNESRYISEIKTALIDEGMIDEDQIELDLNLKEGFTKSDFYKTGYVYANRKEVRSFDHVKSFKDLGVKKKNYKHNVFSGTGKEELGLEENEKDDKKTKKVKLIEKDISFKDIEKHIKQNALAKNDFYTFESLRVFFPKIETKNEFIESDGYLNGLNITFKGAKEDLENINNGEKFRAVLGVLNQIEKDIKDNLTEYIGTEEFLPEIIRKRFTSKRIKISKENERLNGQEEYLSDKDWYVYESNFGTTYEKELVELIGRKVDKLRENFKQIYLIRNERQLKIHNFKDGQVFEPDFLLFLIAKNGKNLTYQLFIEPKGTHLAEGEKWKNDFLEEIKSKYKIVDVARNKRYKIKGIKFYDPETENDFEEKLFEAIKLM